jgi:hypothetical protein
MGDILALLPRHSALGELSQNAGQLLDGGNAVSTVYTYDNRNCKSIQVRELAGGSFAKGVQAFLQDR